MDRQMEQAADDGYVRPQIANELMKAAQGIRRTVYIYGSTGCGKTSFVADFLARRKVAYYTMSDPDALLAAKKEEGCPSVVVVDDLHLIQTAEERENICTVLERLAGDMDVWLILISRAPVPAWLKPLCIRRIFMTIGEQELFLSEKEEEAYLNKWELSLMPKPAQYLRQITGGYPLALRIAALRLRRLPDSESSEARQEKELSEIEGARRDLWDYLQTEVYDRWDVELQEFMMEMSIVDTFDLSMACRITKRRDAGRLILLARESGNFLTERTEDDHTVFEMRITMRRSMHKRLSARCTKGYIDRLYDSAGAEYELQGRIVDALEMYERCHNEDGISRLLIANARRHVGSGYYWELRKYYLSLSEETILQSPELMAGMSMLQSVLLNDDESEKWYRALADDVKKQTGGAKKAAQARLLYLDIALPQRGTVRMTDTLKKAWGFLTEKKVIVPDLSLTNNQPTLMHGGKDFCEWSRRDKELARTIGKPVELLLGGFGKGLVNIALAESFFEKGMEDDYEVQCLAQKGWMQASAGGGRPEIVFVAVGLLAWMSLLNNHVKDGLESLDSFRNTVSKEMPQLATGVDALKVRLLLYTGVGSEVIEWMRTAPDEDAEFCTLERYRYVTKVHVYLATGQKEKALSLLQRLLLYAEKRQRTYLKIEVLALLAIAKHRMRKRDWRKTLQEAVTMAEDYHFVRVLTRGGAALGELLRDKELAWQDADFKKQTLKECRYMAQLYPAYLREKQSERVQLSDKALMVLRLLAEGKSEKQIAEILYISPSGVKYYTRDIYKKLGVNSKVAAVTEARNRKIL